MLEEEEVQRPAATQLAARVLLAPASAFGGTGEFLCTHLRDASVLAREVQHRAPGCRKAELSSGWLRGSVARNHS